MSYDKITIIASMAGGSAAAAGAAGLHAAGRIAATTGGAVSSIASSTKSAIATASGAVGATGVYLSPTTIASLQAAGAGAGKLAAATHYAVNGVAAGTRTAITAAAAQAAGGFNGINLPPNGIKFAVGATVAVAGVTVLLPVVGFTVAGVKAGTWAATIHAGIGNVAAGSLFATLQSVGVVGLATSTKFAIGTAGGLAATCI